MKNLRLLSLVGLSVVVLSFVPGCSSESATDGGTAGTPEARDGLLDLANLLNTVQEEGRPLPKKAADFAQHDVAFPAAGALIQNGTIVYFPGASIDASAATTAIVAMQADADKSGGWVLLSTGEVKDLGAQEIAALPRAGS